MNDNPYPTDPTGRPDGESPFEDRLRSTLNAEHRALEARRTDYGDVPISTAPVNVLRPWRYPALAVLALCFGGLIIASGMFGGADSEGELLVSAPDATPVVATPTAVTDATEAVPSSTPTLPVTTPVVQSDPTPPVTATPFVTPPPPTPLGLEGAPCSADQAPQSGRGVAIVNIADDDADGGLVVHTLPGIDTPVVTVLPPGPTVDVYRPRNCAVLPNGGVWWELLGPDGPVWGNARYLSIIPLEGKEVTTTVRVAFPNEQLDAANPQGFPNLVIVERTTTRADIERFAIEQWLAGPTDAEMDVGLVRPVTLINIGGCGDDEFSLGIDQEGLATVMLCGDAPSAGVGQDARTLTSFDATLLPFARVDRAVLLDRSGRCVGDLNTGVGCRADCNRGATVEPGAPRTTEAAPDGAVVTDHVRSLTYEVTTDCTTITIEFGSGVGQGGASQAVSSFSEGIEVWYEAGVTQVALPENFVIDQTTGAMAETWRSPGDPSVIGAAVLVDAPEGERDYVWISNGSANAPSVSFLPNPARVVIDICCDPTLDTFTAGGFGTQEANGPAGYLITEQTIWSEGVVLVPEDPAAPPEDGQTLEGGAILFGGFGTAFEAVGGVVVFDEHGDIVEGLSYANALKPDEPISDSASFAVGNPGVSWRPFKVFVGGIAPGTYTARFVVCDQCDEQLTEPVVEFTIP